MINLLLAIATTFVSCLIIFLLVIGTLEIDKQVSERLSRLRLIREILRRIIFVISRLLIGDSNLFAVDGIETSTYIRLLTSSLLGHEIIDARIVQIAVMDAVVYFSICFIFWLLSRGIDRLPESIVSYVDRLALKLHGRYQFNSISDEKWLDVRRLNLGMKLLKHMHFPLDVVTFTSIWVESFFIRNLDDHLRKMPQLQWQIVEILDFDSVDDSSWPNCSFIHCVVAFLCPDCHCDNRFYILRTYFYPRSAETIASWPLEKEQFLDEDGNYLLTVGACSQSGGLIFIYMIDETLQHQPRRFNVYDIRQNRMTRVQSGAAISNHWSIEYLLRESAPRMSDEERRKSIFMRLFITMTLNCLVTFMVNASSRCRSITPETCRGFCELKKSILNS